MKTKQQKREEAIQRASARYVSAENRKRWPRGYGRHESYIAADFLAKYPTEDDYLDQFRATAAPEKRHE